MNSSMEHYSRLCTLSSTAVDVNTSDWLALERVACYNDLRVGRISRLEVLEKLKVVRISMV